MGDAKPLLVMDGHLSFVRDRLGVGDQHCRQVTDRLYRVDVGQQGDSAVDAVPDSGDVWGPVADEDRVMRVPTHGDPADFFLEGAPMDYHGRKPVSALRRLASRMEPGLQQPTGEGVLVGVVDTGMRSHPWLNGAYLASPQDFESYEKETVGGRDDALPPQAGHGTFVAGLILQQAPAAGVWVERALEPSGEGFASSVATAATTLARRGVDVLNLSLGCRADEPRFREVMLTMVDDLRCINPRLVIVAAAGNLEGEESHGAFWPAALPNVIAVGAVNGEPGDAGAAGNAAKSEPAQQGSPTAWTPWSNRGPWVDFAAPGENLLSTFLRARTSASSGESVEYHGWAEWSGTSFAAAIVSGAIASTMTEGERCSAADAVRKLRQTDVVTDKDQYAPRTPIVERRHWKSQLLDGAA